MKSMTGFGVSRASVGSVEIEIQVKSVNSRFLEIRTHLPPEYSGLETDLRQELQRGFGRGRIEVTVSRRLQGAKGGANVSVNAILAAEILKEQRALAKKLKLKAPTSVEFLMRFPHVIQVGGLTEVSQKEKEAVYRVFRASVEAFDGERKREGQALRSEVQKLLRSLSSILDSIYDLREQGNDFLRKRFMARMEQLGVRDMVPEDRWLPEIALLIERSDITEEIVRLREHLRSFEDLVKKAEDVQGKKLDFYCQELLREFNTIGSKSQVVEITRWVVDGKTQIEKLKEQVQNIE